jgi:alpha-aminoadipic semialdehyde synthase
MPNTLGIVRETKNEWERRVPLSPDDLKKLLSDHSFTTIIQPSENRIFQDDDYVTAGAIVDQDLKKCDIIIGIKEVKVQDLLTKKVYLYFSHTIKGQSYNMPMLQKLIDLKCTLIDYERMVNEKDQRLIYFSFHAGVAGIIETLWAFGKRLESEGLRSPFSNIRQSFEYPDQAAAEEAFKELGDQIRLKGLPHSITPLTIGITGYGNVSMGVQHMLQYLPTIEIQPDKLPDIKSDPRHSSNHIYQVVFKEVDMVEPLMPTNDFDLQDYYDNPKNYRSKFEAYLKYLAILVNASFWDTQYPKHVTKESLKRLFKGINDTALRVIGDISCDVEGGVECTTKVTDPGNPVYVYEPVSEKTIDGVTGNGPVIMAVDNLPSELPKDASVYFSNILKDFIPELISEDFSKGFNKLDLSYPLKKAIIVYNGELTDDYKYLTKYL